MKRKFSVSLFSCVWFAAMIFFDASYLMPLAAAVALHEAGHLLCAAALKIKVTGFDLSMLGARMEVDPLRLSYGREFMLALSGPLAGAVGFLLAYPISHSGFGSVLSSSLFSFSVISLSLSIFNLIPIDSLDGGRMLRCAVSGLFSPDAADAVMKVSTHITLIFLWLISVYMMLRFFSGLTLFVFSATLFARFFIFKSKMRD